MLKKAIKFIIKCVIRIGFPLTFLSAAWLRLLRWVGMSPLDKNIFSATGLLPVHDHYYQPLVNPKKHLKHSLRDDRPLPGIDFNDKEQLALLEQFQYADELKQFPLAEKEKASFYYANPFYGPGDAEYLYNMVRHFKPAKIVEIGSGYSTLMAQLALKKNRLEESGYEYQQVCIEPYEQSWLEKIGVIVLREKVESIDRAVFTQLEANDILFIDSTHVIRPQGDVLYEFLEILPLIKPGVIIHIHDIFTPKDYPDAWIIDEHRLWNEQYLLEAFLTFNSRFKIIGAVNYLSHHYREEFCRKNPIYSQQANCEPGAFWMVKTS